MEVQDDDLDALCEWLLSTAGLRKLEVERARPLLEAKMQSPSTDWTSCAKRVAYSTSLALA